MISVTSTQVEPIYRGVKVSCLRSNGTTGIPNSYFVSVSAKFAGVGKFDAKGQVSTWGFVKKQP